MFRWKRIVPFFLSAFLFLSALFSVFAALPLLVIYLRNGRKLGWLALITNCLMVFAVGGPSSLAAYAIFIVGLTVAMGESLRHRLSLEKTAALALVGMLLVGAGLIFAHAAVHHLAPIQDVHQLSGSLVNHLADTLSKDGRSSLMSADDLQDWKENFLVEFPSALAVFSLLLVWISLVLVLRVNPKGVREEIGLDARFLRNWRAPEWLVWPTIVCGFLLVVDFGRASDVALNGFRFLMAIYAIQGLSILSFLFDVWNIRGLFRSLGYIVAIFLMMPLLLSLGFFDLWFDFRGKFRQS